MTAATSVVLAFASLFGAFTPYYLQRRRAAHEQLAVRDHEAETRGVQTAASWVALDEALQRENTRLQTTVERLERRIEDLQRENGLLRDLLGGHEPGGRRES